MRSRIQETSNNILSHWQRISNRFNKYVVPGIDDLGLKNIQKGRRDGKSEDLQQLKRTKDYLDSAHKHACGTVVERCLTDEQYQKRIHEQGYTQTDMK